MSAREVWALAQAAVAAILVQPCLFFAWLVVPWVVQMARGMAPPPGAEAPLGWILFLLACVLVVATVSVLLFGIPLFLALLRLRRASMLSVGVAGFVAGAMPLALVTWPLRFSGYSSSANWNGHLVDFYVNGIPTVYGWLSYCAGVLQFGIHGLAGALAFLWVWRRRIQRRFAAASQSSHSLPSL